MQQKEGGFLIPRAASQAERQRRTDQFDAIAAFPAPALGLALSRIPFAISGDRDALNLLAYNLKQEMPALFEELIFDNHDPKQPWSIGVGKLILAFSSTGMLEETATVRGDTIKINPEARRRIENIHGGLLLTNPDDIARIEEALGSLRIVSPELPTPLS